MDYKKAIELRNLLVEDLKKNEKGLTAFLTKANEQWDNEPDWVVCIYEKNGNTIQTPKNVDRLDIRGKVQEAGNSLYESLSFCKPLQYLAGELMAQNEEYVLNHQGDDGTVGTQHILKNGFTDNQISFLKDLGKIIRTADYHEILQTVLMKVDEMWGDVESGKGNLQEVLRDLNQIKGEVESCGTRPGIILKKKR